MMVTGCKLLVYVCGSQKRDAYSSGVATSPLDGVAAAGLDGGGHTGEGELASGLSSGVRSEHRDADDGLEHEHFEELKFAFENG